MLALGLVAGCEVPREGMSGLDASIPAVDGSARCDDDRDCDDGLFCNGLERCSPGAAGAGEDGCVAGRAPCAGTLGCDEAEDQCVPCAIDRDGDGALAPECGGNDCDDSDPDRFPGNTEVCDAAGHDEDCDPTTFGDVDEDGDGAISAACCDASSGRPICGTDCDDDAAGVRPGLPEVCNAIDDDCDGLVDDVMAGVVACVSGSSRPCVTACGVAGTQACRADCLGLEACVADEVCNGCDDDADGARDEDFECERGFPVGCTTACGTAGTRQCSNECTIGACIAAERCNYCDDDGINGFADERVLAGDSEVEFALRGGGTAHGAASEDAVQSPPGGPILVFANLLDGTAYRQAGTYWVDLDKYVGWGPVRFEVQVEAELLEGVPMGGWSFVVANGGTGDLGTPEDYGVPRTLTGVRFDWQWTGLETYYDIPDEGDEHGYQRMVGDGFWPRGLTNCGAGCRADGRTTVPNQATTGLSSGRVGVVTQQLVIEYQPENPYTSAREERVSITAGGSTRVFLADDGIRETSDPGDDLPIGSRLRVGFAAGTYEHTYHEPDGAGPYTARGRVRARALLTRVQPPDSVLGEVMYTDYATISRALICPEN